MANPFFSGRIPPALADKIDAHLLQTGETRSELLIRLLRIEVSDNKPDNSNINSDNKPDNLLLDLLTRVEKLELANNNKGDNIMDNKSDTKLNDAFAAAQVIHMGEAEKVAALMELTWEEFCELMDEPLPTSRTKASADKLIALGLAKGRKSWQYNSKAKKFNPNPRSMFHEPK
jgi:hypothetical protein